MIPPKHCCLARKLYSSALHENENLNPQNMNYRSSFKHFWAVLKQLCSTQPGTSLWTAVTG